MCNTSYHSPIAEDSSLMLLEATVMRVVKVNQNGKAIECRNQNNEVQKYSAAIKQAVLLGIIICQQLYVN